MAIRKFDLETVDSDGTSHKWEANLLPADEGLEVLTQLIGLISPAVGKLNLSQLGKDAAQAKAAGGDGNLEESDEDKLEEAIDEVAEAGLGAALAELGKTLSTPSKKSHRVFMRLLPVVLKDGKKIDPNLEFSGNYGVFSQLVTRAIVENYSSFLDFGGDLGEAVGKLRSMTGA